MAAATRNLLSLTSELFDKSEAVFAESKKLTKLDSRLASSSTALREMQHESRSVGHWLSERLGSSGTLAAALASCESVLPAGFACGSPSALTKDWPPTGNAAVAHLGELGSNRQRMAEARVDALAQQEVAQQAGRQATVAEVEQRRR